MSNHAGGSEELVSRAKTLIEKRTEKSLSIEELADALGLSSSHFHRVFKTGTGMSPYQYYLHLRIERAKQLLDRSSLSVTQIASRLAFDNAYDFSNAFKQRTGMSPTQWRQRGNGKQCPA